MSTTAVEPGSVAVVGGGLAGMAAAARLAKMGHTVTLYEARDTLGGSWAPYALPPSDVGTNALVDDSPAVLGFPAPWRDLFRKSGRPLEAELARAGFALVPARPPTYVFADHHSLVLPSDRGEQWEVLTWKYGDEVARRWRDLLDGLDDVWQAMRPLGVETERPTSSLPRALRQALWSRRTVADLADRLEHPHLRALVRSVAWRQGTDPVRTPALAAVDLSLNRTFGRWHIAPTAQDATIDLGRSSVLAQVLAQRLALRRVDVRTETEVSAVVPNAAGWDVVTLGGGRLPFDSVVLAIDPWTAARLRPGDAGLRQAIRRRRAAGAPTIVHTPTDGAAPIVTETVRLDVDGVPVVTYRRPGVTSVHDFTTTSPRPGHGLAARGFRGWLRAPGTRTDATGVVLASAASPAGPGPSQVVLTGALAAYAVAGRRD